MRSCFHHSIWLCLIALLWISCNPKAIVQSGSYQYLYDLESHDLHPEYIVYHHNDDSTTIHFRVFSSELLYTRSAAGEPFLLNLKVKATISDTEGMVKDTATIVLHEANKNRQGWLLGSMIIPLGTGNWNVLMEFSDVARNLTQPAFLACDKTTSYTSQNYFLTKFETGEPVFGGFVTPGQMVEVYSARNASSGIPWIGKLNSEVKLPPPPFSANAPEQPSLIGAQTVSARQDDTTGYIVEIVGGLYFLTHDASKRSGFTIKTSNTHYPRVKDMGALEWPLRFITSKSEHEEIVKNANPKLLIDRFWLECGGSKEHARELIRTYYRRVEEANMYFSTFTEGWRTDRGMIHLLFGNPNQIIRSPSAEVWNYGEAPQAAMLSFTFKKVDSPYTNNLYVLEREPGYKPYWERMVQVWRSGKIYSE